jgi:hypothetical protein
MRQLAPAIAEVMILEHGRSVFLQRLSDPYWFQAFGCVLGFDWHSSGVTTTVCGALKEGLAPRSNDLGIFVAGGKGKVSRRTPSELMTFGEQLGMDGARLAYNSRMAAKVDSAAVQDGFGIYHHSFFLTSEGEWAVVQQGMRDNDGTARRYHWLGSQVTDFVNEPHAAIASDAQSQTVLNMVAGESSPARAASTEFARQEPRVIDREIARVITMALPSRHWVDIKRDVNPAHLRKVSYPPMRRARRTTSSYWLSLAWGQKLFVRSLSLRTSFMDHQRACAIQHGSASRTAVRMVTRIR